MSANPYRDFVADQKHAVPAVPASAEQPAQQPASTSAAAECGSGWYHDVAIQEAQQAPARKH